jgi:hypothetical protein
MPPSVASRFVSAAGSASSNAPKSDASTRNSSAMAPTTQRLCSTAPNMEPDSPAATPSGTNIATIPSTNAAESAAPSQRLFASRAPNTLTVTATIG